MSVSFVQRNAAKRQGGGVGLITVPYHASAQAGDLQLLMVSTFASGAPAAPSGSGWSQLHSRADTYSLMAIYVRTLVTADLTSNVTVNLTASDWGNAELRTYRPSGAAAFELAGSGEGLVAAAVTAKALLVRCWAEAQNNSSGGSAKTLTAPAGLLNSGSPTSYNWYDGGLAGDDPVANGAAGTSTAVHGGGGESRSSQWANVQISEDLPTGDLTIALPPLVTSTDVTVPTSGDLDIVLPPVVFQASGATVPAGHLDAVLPPLAYDAAGRSQLNYQIVFMPPLVADASGNRTLTEMPVTLPALSVETVLDPNQPPDFTTVMRALDPDLWWTMDASDAREVIADGDWAGWQRIIDASGHGSDGALYVAGGSSFPDGLVVDSLDTAFEGTAATQVATISTEADPVLQASAEFSAFVLVDYVSAAPFTGYGYHGTIGRQGVWALGLQDGYYDFKYHAAGGGVQDHLLSNPAVGYSPEGPASLGVIISRDPAGVAYVQAFLNGVPTDPEPVELYGGLDATYDPYYWSGIRVGADGAWAGLVQHAAHFKRALVPSDFAALHASAFAARAKRSRLRAPMPALTAGIEAMVPDTLRADVVMPALSFDAYDATLAAQDLPGAASWHDAVPVTRGKQTRPAARLSYPEDDDSGLVWPYFSSWWKWTADVTTEVWFSTFRSIPIPGQGIDTVLVVYTEAGGVLTEVFSNDDVDNWNASQVVIPAPVLGETYYIRCGSFNNSGSGIASYVLDNDLTPAPTLADLIVADGGRGPAGAGDKVTAPLTEANSVSAPTHIPAGQQAWWLWTADYNGTISFDALLSQHWFTGGAGSADPRVGLELWDDSEWLAYSEGHGTVETVPRGQISWNVIAGHRYYIKLTPLGGDINAFLRISPLAFGSIVTPAPKSFVIDATPLDRDQVASSLSLPSADLKYYSELGAGPVAIDHTLPSGYASPVQQFSGFYGHYRLTRAYAGVEPQLDHMGSLSCLWEQARTGSRDYQFWGKYASGYWYGPEDPYDEHGSVGRGDCASNWYTNAVISDAFNSAGAVGASFWSDGTPPYQSADIATQGTHFQLSVSELVKSLRDRPDVRDDAVVSAISLMADEPATRQENIWGWFVKSTRPKVWNDGYFKQWGPDYNGSWWGSGVSDAEQFAWMDHNIFSGYSPKRDGAAIWTPLPDDVLTEAHAFENDTANDLSAGVKGRGLTLAYLPPEVARHEPPYQLWRAFGYETASVSAMSYGARVLMKVDLQELPYLSDGQPLGSDGSTFPVVIPYDPNSYYDNNFPPALDPGPVGSQILFGPYPVKFSPVIDVLVFGPRHKNIPWPEVQATAAFETELVTQVPVPNADPLARPAGSVRFVMPELTILEGIPRSSKAAGRIAFTSETSPPALVSQLFSTPHLVDLGEDLRFPPILATSQVSTSSYRRHPTDPLLHRTSAEVTSLPSSDGSVTLASPLPGPERVSSYAYWRGAPAATTAVSFRSTLIGEESLAAATGDWITGDEFTVLLAVVLDDASVQGPLSPLVVAASPTGAPRAGLFFNSDSEVLLWDAQHDVDDITKRVRGKVQLLDDIRRVSQPVLVGARIDNVTGKVTLVAADSRLRTVETSLAAPIGTDHQLLIGDAGTLTSPGAFDMLDMRWWRRSLTDAELLSAAAAMTDLWGVLA